MVDKNEDWKKLAEQRNPERLQRNNLRTQQGKNPCVGEREFRLIRLKMPVNEIRVRVAGYPVTKGDTELGFVFGYKGRWLIHQENRTYQPSHSRLQEAIDELIAQA
jgi:hypothetical protein